MNLVGKIMLFATLVMSIVFMSFAVAVYATHKNWKEAIEAPNGLKAQLEKARHRPPGVGGRTGTAQGRAGPGATGRPQPTGQAGIDPRRIDRQAQGAGRRAGRPVRQGPEGRGRLDTAHANLAKLTTEVEALRKDIRVAQADRDKQFAAVVDVTDKNPSVRGRIDSDQGARTASRRRICQAQGRRSAKSLG